MAVTNTADRPYLAVSFSTINSNKVLFPVPAPPVKNTFLPARQAVVIRSCSEVTLKLSCISEVLSHATLRIDETGDDGLKRACFLHHR